MKRVVKILFEPGEKMKLFDILQKSDTTSGAKLAIQEEMDVDALTALAAVDRFWKIAKEKQSKS